MTRRHDCAAHRAADGASDTCLPEKSPLDDLWDGRFYCCDWVITNPPFKLARTEVSAYALILYFAEVQLKS
jgi:hypothetical protein